MKTEITEAISALIKKATSTPDGGDAMKYTQAALNLAHAEAVIVNTAIQRRELPANTAPD